jgi:Putative adhesin
MGKRELVLIAVFVVLGFCVYQLTAPPPLPGSEGVSISGIFRNMRRTIHGASESAAADSAQTVPVDATVKELRLNIVRPGDLTVAGEDRADIAAELHTTARGYDQAEAKASADATKLKIERVGDAMVVSLDSSAGRNLPRNNSVAQMVILLKVPRRLAMRMEPHSGRLIVSQLASGEIIGSRGETRITGIPGRLVLTHSGGSLELEDLGSLKLNARNSRGTVKKVGGALAVDSTGGDLAMTDITGPLEIEGRNTDLKIDDLKNMKAPLRINSTGGEIIVRGLRSEARLDGRNNVIDVALAAPAVVTIYNLGEIRVTAPPGGYTIDAVATEGHITMDDGDLKPSDGPDPHVAGPVRGGGPTLTLRSTRGGITVRKPAGK